MAFYTNNSVASLAEDVLLKCGQLYASKFLVETTGTTGTVGATCDITLVAGVASDDLYNNKTLYIVDDNSKLCTVNIDDSVASTDTIVVDTTATVQISDGSSAGSFTSSTAGYNLYILDTEEFVGYSTQSLDYEEETVEFLDCNDVVREDISKVILGFSGECKNFSSDKTFANIFNLTQYGSQSGQKEYHGGFDPAVKSYYQVRLATENVVDKAISITLFKGNFFGNGAVDMSSAGEYKMVPYRFKAYKDTLRDATTLNAWSISEAT